MTPTFVQHSITSELSFALIAAAEARATELGMGIATWIIDGSGVLKAFSRMDNAPLVAADSARKKALTAVGFGMPTGETWHAFIKDDPILAGGAGQLEHFILLGGGAPIRVDGVLCGAIGVAGGHYSHDEKCVEAALSVLDG